MASYATTLCCFSLVLCYGCTYVESTISSDADALSDMSLASVAYRKTIASWPTNAEVLDAFSREKQLSFRAERFQVLHFTQSNDTLLVDYVVAENKTRGKTSISLVQKTSGSKRWGQTK